MNPVPHRKLKARAALKDLTLRQISELSGVPYSQASQVLNGRLIHADYLQRIEKAITNAPEPK